MDTRERRKTERRRGHDPRQEALLLLTRARNLIKNDIRYVRYAERVKEIISDMEDATRTVEKRGNERRDISRPTMRLRAVG